MKVFPDKQKLKEFITTRPALQEIFKGAPAVRNGKTTDSNSKPYDKIKIFIKKNTRAFIKACILVTTIVKFVTSLFVFYMIYETNALKNPNFDFYIV